jgi:hypothetical protein
LTLEHASSARAFRAFLALLIALWASDVSADAIIRTQAMLASTIAEYYVQDGGVTAELEIGLSNLEGFRNLLPDEIYEKLGYPPQPLQERLTSFFRQDFVVLGEDGEPLPGRVLEIGPRERVRRDEITGEPLPATGDEAETIVFARLEYAFAGRPRSLTLGGAAVGGAGIGYVVYHDQIAVNDFRYLGREQTLDLDWTDPWYTRFRNRTLQRANFASMSGFLYIEPYEVRKEIILRPKDLRSWVDLGLTGRDTIPVELQDEVKRNIAEFLRLHHPVRIDGEEVSADLAQINFLERTLRTSRVIDPPVELDLDGAILGAIFVYPVAGLPQQVEMEWDLWNERIQRVPASAVDQAGPLPTYLEPDSNTLTWQNFLKNPELPTQAVLSTPPTRLTRWVHALRWPLVAGTVALVAWCLLGIMRKSGSLHRNATLTCVAIFASAASFWLGRDAQLSPDITGRIVSGLLHNIYLAHDFREEGKAYDVLGQSVTGELLTDIYLETRRGLELANQGGARAKVKALELTELEAEPGAGGSFLATATWVVRGSVGHWGHLHERSNRYRAEIDVRPVEGVWKVANLLLLQEERL